MANILLHDTRVRERAPASDLYVPINEQNNLQQVINNLAIQISLRTLPFFTQGYLNTLHILAHGSPQGILLGSPGLSQLNVRLFTPLYRKVNKIIFHSCEASAVMPGGYNGEQMCLMLSRIIQGYVMAADTTQHLDIDTFYNATDNTTYAPWRGTVTTYWNGTVLRASTPEIRESGVQPYF